MKEKLLKLIDDLDVQEYLYLRRGHFNLKLIEFQEVIPLLKDLEKSGIINITDTHQEDYTGNQLIDLLQIQKLK